MKRILEQFNRSDTYLVISDYPEQVTGEGKNHGIAWHTKETTLPFIREYGHKFVILAEKGRNIKPELHEDKQLLVLRVFDQRHHSLFPTILKWLMIFSNIKKVYIHSEFCTSGGVGNFILLIPFLILIKVMGRKIIYFEHNVVTRFDSIATHFGMKPRSLKLLFLNFGLYWYYRLLGILVDKIVVMDRILYKRMTKFVNKNKISCQPFWIEKKDFPVKKSQARTFLGVKRNEYLIVYFGFISWYKGADWLIDQVRRINNKKIKLILVGGEAYSLKDKDYYQKFYSEQLNKQDEKIKITGFVPEKDVCKYFAAADLVIFPYRGYFGASGSLSYALSYGKPFLLSGNMAEIFLNEDFCEGLKETGLKKKEILFEMTFSAFRNSLNRTLKPNRLLKLKMFSEYISRKRNINILMPKFNSEIYQMVEKRISLPLPLGIIKQNL